MATLDRLGPPPASAAPVAPAWGPRRAIAVALFAAAAIALLQVIMSSSFTYTGQKLQHLEVQRVDLQARVYQLEADVAALASLDRTERIARDRLGMVPARGGEYLSVSVEAPSGALLPRPILDLAPPAPAADLSWWREVLAMLSLP